MMRRTNRRGSGATLGGLILLALAVLTVSSVAAWGLAPKGGKHAPAPPAGTPWEAMPTPAAGPPSSAVAPTTGQATATTAEPVSTQLVSLRPSAPYLLYYPVAGQNVAGELGPTTWGGPTVRPVVAAKGEWLQILLDSRPNGSTAWVRKADVVVTSTPYRIVISVSQHSLTLYQNGSSVYSAPVGVGQPQWPTPLGPSFVDAIYPVAPRQQYIYGPVALITASHSNVFTEFDGGDGTVAIHGYPSDPASTAGVASSHGCIRANPQTMTTISQVPPGTPIDFVA